VLSQSDADRVAEVFALGSALTLDGPVAKGRLGEIWRLTTERGAFAVKESVQPIDPTEAESDAAYQDLVRAGGVPMPALVRTSSGTVVAELSGLDLAGPSVRVYGWVDVLAPERRLEPEHVGRLFAAIHRVRVWTEQPVDPWYAAPVGAASWTDLVARLRRAGAPFADPLDDLLPEILRLEALLRTPDDDLQVCHRDLWADNVLRTPAGGLTVLDWENSGAASPSQELAVAMFEYGCGESDRMRTLHTAYVDAGGPGRVRESADLTMLIAQTGQIAREGCLRWLAATTDDARADNAAWVGEFLEEPISRATVDAILDAAAP
jgi:Ser/Thr protein kinase RdoA (MazF antagonist)